MRNLLSDNEIKAMREELCKDLNFSHIEPPKGRNYWSVHRIVATLEYFQAIEKKYNDCLNSDAEKRGVIHPNSISTKGRILLKVDLKASSYEWTCPKCEHLNNEYEITEEVTCVECGEIYEVGEVKHADR